jgi:hypothetical protein
MNQKDFNELAGKLIEYDMELSQREIKASKKRDFETIEEINRIRYHICELLEIIDKEVE